MTYIYLVTNCYNNSKSVYIGKTTQPQQRKSKHKFTYGETIEFTIIDQVDSFERADWKPLENYWIEQFIQWGFNIQNKNIGGNGPTHLTPEQREHLRVQITGKTKGKPKPDGFGDKIRRLHAGKPKPDGFGAAHSAKLKGKPNLGVSAALKGKPRPHVSIALKGKLQGRRKTTPEQRIGMLDKVTGELIKIWDSQTDATLALGKNSTAAISECCNGKRKSTYGYKWVWLP